VISFQFWQEYPMSDPIVQSSEPITLVGGGAASEREVSQARAIAPGLVAADGGAALCLRAGQVPQAIIGDMDSLSHDTREQVGKDRLFPIAEQDSTDFDKALRHIKAPLVLGVGFTGGRVDHQLACFNTLVRHPDRRCLLISDTDIVYLAPPVLRLKPEAGSRVSLYPMGLVEGQSRGLEWPIAGLVFAADGRIGTSNRASGEEVELLFTAPKMLIIQPVSELDRTVQALSRTDAHWPSP
jgi:thiamine pyrophosphokinase